MVRVTANTNIYISALNFGGPPDKLIDLARTGEIHLSISDDRVNEVTRVLRDKFRWTEEAIRLAQERIADFTEHVAPLQPIEAVKADPSDNRILECAQACSSEFTVTGDNHLLSLGSFGGAEIMSVSEFLRARGRGATQR